MIARSHHEKWNGAGYPDGLKDDAIPLVGRIVAIAVRPAAGPTGTPLRLRELG